MRRINRLVEPLTDEQILAKAPSAFAIEPWHGQSSRYAFVPTSNVIAGMRASGFLPYLAMQSTSRIEGKENFTRHMLKFRPANSQLTQVGDTIVEATLVNSHDGTSRYEVSLGAYRLACSNGAMVSEGLAEIIKIRHTGNIIQNVVDATAGLIEQAPKVIEAITSWKRITLNTDESLAFARAAHVLRFEDATNVPEPAQLLQVNRLEDRDNDLWTVFNRVQENTVRGGLRHEIAGREDAETGRWIPSRRQRTREVKGITQNLQLNRALWTLAEELAKLKG